MEPAYYPTLEDAVNAIYPIDPSFDFEQRVRKNLDPFGSPLSSLSPSPTTSRSPSPEPCQSPSPATLASTSSPPALHEGLSRGERKKRRHKSASKRLRRKKREDAIKYESALKSSKKHFGKAVKISPHFDGDNFRIASTGYVGRNTKADFPSTCSLGDLIGPESKLKFTLMEWDEK